MDAVLNEYLYPDQVERLSETTVEITYYLSRCPLQRESFYGVVHINGEILYDLSVNQDGTIYWQNLIERKPGRPRLVSGILDNTLGLLTLVWQGNPGAGPVHFLNATYEGHFEVLGDRRLEPSGVNRRLPTNWSEEGF